MKIEIQTYNQVFTCDSGDPDLIGRWFAEHAKTLMSANAAMMPYRVYIWPSSEREQNILSGPERLRMMDYLFTSKALRELAHRIEAAAERAEELERS